VVFFLFLWPRVLGQCTMITLGGAAVTYTAIQGRPSRNAQGHYPSTNVEWQCLKWAWPANMTAPQIREWLANSSVCLCFPPLCFFFLLFYSFLFLLEYCVFHALVGALFRVMTQPNYLA
jgi:hypothetical protein